MIKLESKISAKICAALLLFCFVPTFALAQKTAKVDKKPNIILILSDDFGYGDLGSYGQKFIKTPNLDLLAQSGIRFTQFYAAAPVCAPSRASLMTGKHQGHALIRGNTDDNNQRVPLRPEDVTIAEVLKTAGYRTAVIGKWGLGEPETTGIPNKEGFDYFFGYLNQNHAHNYYTDYLWRNRAKVKIPPGAYSHDLFTRDALDFIERERANPFFLYLAYTIPHANNELGRRTGNGMEVPSDAPYTKENWTPQQKNYAAMITRMDTDIGKILALLKELKIDDNTIVIFTGDNGPQGTDEGGYDQTLFNSNGNLRGIKRELYEGGIREPLIISWKGKIKAGQTSDFVWASWDFMPTFAAIAGAKSQIGIDGISALPVLLGQKQPARKFLYWEFHEGGYAQAVRMGNWKAVRHGVSGKIELYNLQTDVGEKIDLAAKNPGIVRQITEIMKREHMKSEHWSDRDKITNTDKKSNNLLQFEGN
jgi:arylsulfatase A-like enzyme